MSAIISPCGQYRYRLEREVGGLGATTVIMVNPSTADASSNDATIRKLIGFGIATALRNLAQPVEPAEVPCPKCDDSGWTETASGGIWTGENVTVKRSVCDCACGDDVRRELAAQYVATPSKSGEAPSGGGWQPIETVPRDDIFLAAIRVRNNESGKAWWERHLLWLDDETGEIATECEQGWGLDDYKYWAPVLAQPAGEGEVSATLCDDHGARMIARQTDAPDFIDSATDVQEYWLCLADALASLQRGEG